MQCKKCGKEMRTIPAGVSAAGKTYGSFAVCDNCPKPAKTDIAKAMIRKEKSISQFQDRKGQSISEAQTRNEVMYGKVNACLLVANHPAYKTLTKDEVEAEIQRLTNKIINMELLPF